MPRILTNKFNLPPMIEKAIRHDSYKIGGDLSCSALIDAPQINVLKKQNDYEEDISDLLDALMGTSLHSVLERATIDNVRKSAFQLTMETLMDKYKTVQDEQKKAGMLKVIEYLKKYSDAVIKIDERYETEKTLACEIDGITIYGTRDLYDTLTNTIEDYKSCKVYAWLYEEARIKWMQQLNVYAYLSIVNGYDVKGLVINAFFKDWNSGGLQRNQKDYPPHRIMRIPVKLYDMESLTKFVHHRVKLHKQALEGNVPLCSGKERWSVSDTYAVKHAGTKRALKVFDEKNLAQTWFDENKQRYKNPFIEVRPGDSRRCKDFCVVAPFCNQRKEELKKQLEIANES
jgi:hypothetical protein